MNSSHVTAYSPRVRSSLKTTCWKILGDDGFGLWITRASGDGCNISLGFVEMETKEDMTDVTDSLDAPVAY